MPSKNMTQEQEKNFLKMFHQSPNKHYPALPLTHSYSNTSVPTLQPGQQSSWSQPLLIHLFDTSPTQQQEVITLLSNMDIKFKPKSKYPYFSLHI